MKSRQAPGPRHHRYFLAEVIPSPRGWVSSLKMELRGPLSTALSTCSGVMSTLCWLRASLLASSRMLAVRYSRTPVKKTDVSLLRRWTSGASRRRRSTRLTGNCSSALWERETACFLRLRVGRRLLSPDIVTGFANQTSWIVLLAWASPDTSDFSCPLYSGAPAPHLSWSCLCDNSDFVMSLMSTGP